MLLLGTHLDGDPACADEQHQLAQRPRAPLRRLRGGQAGEAGGHAAEHGRLAGGHVLGLERGDGGRVDDGHGVGAGDGHIGGLRGGGAETERGERR
jgi:hypothetical protein